MTTIYVKPAPDLDPAAAKLLKSDTGVGLLDSAGQVPEAGMPWPNGGLTLVLLRDGAILRADDPVFAALKAKTDAAAVEAAEATAKAGQPAAAPAPNVQHEAEPVALTPPAGEPEAAAK